MPISETMSSASPCVLSCIPIISSPSSRFMPITPIAFLPIARTSVSLKRIHIPYFVIRKISEFSSVAFTSISSSSSRSEIAASPFLRTFENSIIGVFFVIPFFVTINRCLPSANSRIGIIAEIFSPGFNCSRFTIAVPLAVLPASGIS